MNPNFGNTVNLVANVTTLTLIVFENIKKTEKKTIFLVPIENAGKIIE